MYMQVCPYGLHITMGIFLRLFVLLEDECHAYVGCQGLWCLEVSVESVMNDINSSHFIQNGS